MTSSKQPAPAPEMIELAAGVENLRRMFRQTMARAAIERGESLEEARRRIAVDPATAKVAVMLSATVEELLAGFGEEQVFLVDPAYDHAAETARVEAVVAKVASTAIGLNDVLHADAVERVRRTVPLAAPHVESRRDVGRDVESRRMIVERMQRRSGDRAPRVTKSFSERWGSQKQ